MSSNHLFVALDLARGEYVCAPIDPADPCMDELRASGNLGARVLICALCYAGVGALPGTRIPVVVKGRIGGERRPHFAHPPGQQPTGRRHAPESIWHLASKMTLVTWARTQPCVVDVRTEVWLPNRERRCDVRVTFSDGHQLTLEVQSSPLSDTAWNQRHQDYHCNGVGDVWLWHPDSSIPWMVLRSNDRQQQLWILDPWKGSITLMVGAPHNGQLLASGDDALRHVQHLPPCVGDKLVPYEFPLRDLVLTPQGIVIPPELEKQLADRPEQHEHRVQIVENLISGWSAPQSSTTASAPAPPGSQSRPPAIDNEAPVPAQQSLDGAAQAHLNWIILQNALHAAGHVIDYHDAPQLRLPPTKPRVVRCTRCGELCPPNVAPESVQTCRPGKDSPVDRPAGQHISRDHPHMIRSMPQRGARMVDLIEALEPATISAESSTAPNNSPPRSPHEAP
ncbi:competence protein CoiA family protein [Nocardia yunnanensis]|uniref:competence protein CoiA family protein n=1 Tax=Nocardia yunnanensis TaxID=2382165 RepID=UPI0013C4D749|nr:competence protein CoiA family protein [Nocardia yunnanensis]